MATRKANARAGCIRRTLCGVIVAASTAAYGAEAPPLALAKARIAFASALAAKDLSAAAAATIFPLKVAAMGLPPTVSRSAFPKFMQRNGYEENAGCIKSEPLERADSHEHGANVWLVNCNGNIFYFALATGAWRHSGYENINE